MNELSFGNIIVSSPEDILNSREQRVYYQQNLINKYKKPLLCMRANYPGLLKNNDIALGIMKILNETLVKEFDNFIIYADFSLTWEGPILSMIINKPSFYIKKKAVQIEEGHPLGRCVDIDVYSEEFKGLSRRDMGISPRRCYICNEDAQSCVRARKHNLEEIETYIKKKYENYCKTEIK